MQYDDFVCDNNIKPVNVVIACNEWEKKILFWFLTQTLHFRGIWLKMATSVRMKSASQQNSETKFYRRF